MTYNLWPGQVKRDVVIGTGWSGDIKGGGCSGGNSHIFTTKTACQMLLDNWLLRSRGDYTFPNSLYLHASVIYNSKGSTEKAGIVNPTIVLRETSAKFLTLSRMDLFGQISYQISPLWRGDLASIVNPYDDVRSLLGLELAIHFLTTWNYCFLASFLWVMKGQNSVASAS
jgi:hypothetical protein